MKTGTEKKNSVILVWTGVSAFLLFSTFAPAEQPDQDKVDFGRLSQRLFETHRPWVARKLELSPEQQRVVSGKMLRYHETMKKFIESQTKDTKRDFHEAWSDAEWSILRVLSRDQRDKLSKLRHLDFTPTVPTANLVRFLPTPQVSRAEHEYFPSELIEPLWKAEGTREEYAALIRKCREDLLTWAIGKREPAKDLIAGRLDPPGTPPGPRYLLMPHATPAVINRFKDNPVPEGVRVEVEASLVWLKKQDQVVAGPFWHDEEQLIVSQQFSPSGRLILTVSETRPRKDNYGKVHRLWNVATGNLLWESFLPLDVELAILDDETLLLPTPFGADLMRSSHGSGSLLLYEGRRLTMDSGGLLHSFRPPRSGDAGATWAFIQTTAGMQIKSPAGYLAFDETGKDKKLKVVPTPSLNTMWSYHSYDGTFHPCHSSLKGLMIGSPDPDDTTLMLARGVQLILSKTPMSFQIEKAPPN